MRNGAMMTHPHLNPPLEGEEIVSHPLLQGEGWVRMGLLVEKMDIHFPESMQEEVTANA